MSDAMPPIVLTIDGTEYPVRWSEVTARQVGTIRLMHGPTPQALAQLVDAELVDLPEVVALAHLSRLQAGDTEFDADALLDSVTLVSVIAIDPLVEPSPSVVDADPQP